MAGWQRVKQQDQFKQSSYAFFPLPSTFLFFSQGVIRRSIITPAVRITLLNGRSFFVVIPSDNHQEGQRMLLVVVSAEHPQRVLEGLPATRVHLAIATPRRLRIVEARPGRANRDLVRILAVHRRVEILEIVFAPVA